MIRRYDEISKMLKFEKKKKKLMAKCKTFKQFEHELSKLMEKMKEKNND